MSEGRTMQPSPVRIEVEVTPRACGDEVLGWARGILKIRVAAPARNGAADRAAETLLAEVLRAPREHVRVVAGRGARLKTLEVRAIEAHELDTRLPGRAESLATAQARSAEASLPV